MVKRSKEKDKKESDDELDVTKIKKPWSLSSDGKPLSRNTIYIGDVLPDFFVTGLYKTYL